MDAEALTVLCQTTAPLTGRRVAELARRGTHTAMTKALDRLALQGLVEVRTAGRANLYTLNREHLLAPAIAEAVAADVRLRERISEQIRSWTVPCVHASIYGSFARGEAGKNSDIDLLVVRPDGLEPDESEGATWSRQLMELEESVWTWTGNPLSWLEMTLADLRRGAAATEPIFESWRDDAIVVVGDPVHRLIGSPPTRRAG